MTASPTTTLSARQGSARLVARDLMTREVLTAPPDMPVEVLAKLMAGQHVSGVPVLDGKTGALLGVVTEADLIRRVAAPAEPRPGWLAQLLGDPARMAERYVKVHGLAARDVMTPAPLATVEEEASAEEVARLMEQRKVKRVPVLRDGRLVGIVSRADLMRAVLRAPAMEGARSEDERIEREIAALARKEPWNTTRWLAVRVRDGVVELHGFCNVDEVRHALRVLAGRVEGVRRVEDRMYSLPYHVWPA